jgi:hypothetical protein
MVSGQHNYLEIHYQKLKSDRDAIRRVIEANPRAQNTTEGTTEKPTTPAANTGKVIQYDEKGNRI